MTLNQVSSSDVYLWYSNIKVTTTLEVLNYLKEQVLAGNVVFYSIYPQATLERHATKRDTGLFFFRGNPETEYAIVNAGGGFYYVGALHDSFPQALGISKQGYNAFALIYRPDDPYGDLAQAIRFINANAPKLRVSKNNYSLWGGSAGARMAAVLGNRASLTKLIGNREIPQAAAVITQYTGYSQVSKDDAPTYACVGTRDGIASWQVMQNRLLRLEKLGIATKFQVFDGLGHGFGLGLDTVAGNWIEEAIAFWRQQMIFD